jgi:uncharacterized RDD family membrane protein YckC
MTAAPLAPGHDPAPLPRDYIGFWWRLFAAIVDLILLVILSIVVGLLMFGSARTTPSLVHFLIDNVLPIGVLFLFWLRKQATPGKLMVHARIVDARTGADPRPGQFVLRFLGYFVSLCVLGLGFFWIAFDRKKQGWHDKLASTIVVREPDPLLDPPARAVG